MFFEMFVKAFTVSYIIFEKYKSKEFDSKYSEMRIYKKKKIPF